MKVTRCPYYSVDLNGYFIRLDLTVDKRLDLAWTYEMLY